VQAIGRLRSSSRCGTRPRALAILAGAVAAGVATLRHGRHAAPGHRIPGGILIGDADADDTLNRLLLGSFADRTAADVAAVTPAGARVLEVWCGPGHLSIRLACRGFEVTGLGLDRARIARAQANADRLGVVDQRRPSFVVGAVAALGFLDESWDLVASNRDAFPDGEPVLSLARPHPAGQRAARCRPN
jgi:SAM-dependent methyltransferase